MDGEITIGTTLSTDKFDKQINNLEKKMSKEENKNIEIEAELKIKETSLEELRAKARPIKEEMEKINREIMSIESKASVTPTEFTKYGGLVDTYNELNHQMNEFVNKNNKLQAEITRLNNKHKQINDNVSQYKQKIATIKLEKQVSEVNKMKESFNGVGSSIQNSIHKVTKLLLGVFSVRSAYIAVRQAVSNLAEYNGALAGQIQAIKLSLVSIIEPVVNFIVNTVGKAVGFIGYILKSLFGINIFANATAIAFAKVNKEANGANKAIKEISKQLVGFDEANVLSETGTVKGVNNLSTAMQDFKNTKTALADLEKEGESVAKNLRKWFVGSEKTDFKGIWEDNLKIIKNFLTNMKTVFKPIVDWVKKNVWDPIKNNFKTAIKAMEPILKPLKNAFKSVVDIFKSYWTSFKKFFNDKIIKPIKDAFKGIGTSLYNAIVPYINKVIQSINIILQPFGKEIKEINTKKTNSSGGGFRAKGGIFYPSKLPKLASGGIINQPR